MNLQKCFAVACIVNMLSAPAHAVFIYTDINAAVAQVSADSTLLSGWTNDQMEKTIAFNSTAGNVVPTQLKLFGFEVGVEGVVTGTKNDVDGFHQLGTQLIDTTKIKIYDRTPFPSILGHFKIGLPFGLDAGVRIGGIPSETYNNDTTHFDISNTIFGLDLRKKIIEEGVTKPFGLTVGLNYTHAKGHIDVSSPYTATASNVTVGGQTYTPSFSATGEERTEWKTDSVGAQVLLNKKILFINPYIGASANANSGHVNSSINNVGNLVLTDPNNVNPTLTQALTAGGSATGKPTTWDLRGLAGLEFTILPFCKLGIGGEFANENRLTGTIGLRIQFH